MPDGTVISVGTTSDAARAAGLLAVRVECRIVGTAPRMV
jgi:hypothetical protein